MWLKHQHRTFTKAFYNVTPSQMVEFWLCYSVVEFFVVFCFFLRLPLSKAAASI